MNQFINMEVKFFLMSVAWGAILLVMYDCLRILRKVVKHGAVLMSMEDIIYWTISSVLIFRMMYRLNDGIIRGFSLLGILLGMVIYKYTISDYVVKAISFILIKIKMFIKKVIHILLRPLKFLGKQGKRLFSALLGKLKLGIGRMAHFMKIYTRTLRKALQSRKKRVRMRESDSHIQKAADSKQRSKPKRKHQKKNAAKQNKMELVRLEEKSKRVRKQEEQFILKEMNRGKNKIS